MKNNRTKGDQWKVLKWVLLILSIVAIVFPAIMALGSLSERVDNIDEKLNSDGPVYTEKINKLDTRVIELEKIAAGTEVSLGSIQSDVTEIKSDIKGIYQNLQNNPEGN